MVNKDALKTLPYQERLKGYERDKAKLSPKLDPWTRDMAIKDLIRKWGI